MIGSPGRGGGIVVDHHRGETSLDGKGPPTAHFSTPDWRKIERPPFEDPHPPPRRSLSPKGVDASQGFTADASAFTNVFGVFEPSLDWVRSSNFPLRVDEGQFDQGPPKVHSQRRRSHCMWVHRPQRGSPSKKCGRDARAPKNERIFHISLLRPPDRGTRPPTRENPCPRPRSSTRPENSPRLFGRQPPTPHFRQVLPPDAPDRTPVLSRSLDWATGERAAAMPRTSLSFKQEKIRVAR
jgi:hypothetical protein